MARFGFGIERSRLIVHQLKLFTNVIFQIDEPLASQIPTEPPMDYKQNMDFLKLAHSALMEIEIIDGSLVCPETGREFKVTDGIPNMLVNEEEVE